MSVNLLGSEAMYGKMVEFLEFYGKRFGLEAVPQPEKLLLYTPGTYLETLYIKMNDGSDRIAELTNIVGKEKTHLSFMVCKAGSEEPLYTASMYDDKVPGFWFQYDETGRPVRA